ncbi:MAG: hypothetical protein IJ488_03150 [Clostridia bacterium]|nr:hypothetical protein [Clostridia bacterium]
MIYEPMHMHLHTCHQPGGSMEGHIYNAKNLRMRYIRFTDHDTRTGRKKNPINRFDFSLGERIIDRRPLVKHGFELFGEVEAAAECGRLVLKASAESEEYAEAGAYFFSEGTRHTVSLIAEVSLLLGMKFKTSGDAHIYLDVRLSQRPPDHTPAHLVYSFDGYDGQSTPHTLRLPIEEREDGLYRLSLSDDISELYEIGGLDNVFDTVLITVAARRGGSAEIILDRFEIFSKYSYDGVITRQRRVADEIGKRYGVKPFVTTEISGAGQHKNVFSTCVPVIDYEARGYSVSAWEAVEHVKAHGGIFAYNHPFENNKFKAKKDLTPEEVSRYVINEAASLVSTKAYGASLIEIGFAEGRGAFGLAEYLRLWDTLSLSGIFITGYGDSDSHKNGQSWYEGNNFASWIGISEDHPYPAPEEAFIEAMKRGRVYMGDPVYLNFAVSLECEGATLGDAVYSDSPAHRVRFFAATADSEYTVRLIQDGRAVYEGKTVAGEDFSLEYDYTPEYPLGFVRAEMYNQDGRCIMLTNPIYFATKGEYLGEIPSYRLWEGKTVC